MKTSTRSYQVQHLFKRSLDIVASLLGMTLLLPLLVLISLAVRLDSPGPVFFRHKRIGQHGRPFELLKFRSMASNSDDGKYLAYLETLIENSKNGTPAPYRKLQHDPRITRVGRFLRRYYLDELPQLFNIFKGEMTLVGPRPHVQLEVDHYTPDQLRRLSIRPGATGLWQVFGKRECNFNDLIALDLHYIDHWSFWLDLQVLSLTMLLMLRGGESIWTRLAQGLPHNLAPVEAAAKNPAPAAFISILPLTGNPDGEEISPN